jgi:peptidoglycan/LPS O-acetylase OafA/YrhL
MNWPDSVWFQSPLPYLAMMLLFYAEAAILLRLAPQLRLEMIGDEAKRNFTPQLEGLRGMLAFSVVVHHCVVFHVWRTTGMWLASDSVLYLNLGAVPVCIFFFLTGYLFWMKGIRQPRIEMGNYLLARLRRLGPVYAFAIAIIFLLVGLRSDFALHTSPIALVGNMFRWLLFGLQMPDINHVRDTSKMIAMTPWTLAFEWGFYLLLPIMSFFFARRSWGFLWPIGTASLLTVVAEHFKFGATPGTLSSFLFLFIRSLGFLFGIGMAAAELHQRFPKIDLSRSRWASATSATLLILVTGFLGTQTPDPVKYVLLGVAFVLFVFGNRCFGLLTARPMLLMGKVSYSSYLLHGLVLWSVITAIEHWTPISALAAPAYWGLMAGTGAVVLVVSVMSYRLLEFPYFKK